jgi:hypothetical protein
MTIPAGLIPFWTTLTPAEAAPLSDNNLLLTHELGTVI